jgi:dTDP-4-dehydrorhamnose reductase
VRILCIGTQGQVARALAERGAAAGGAVTTVGRPDLDLMIPSSIENAIGRTDCDVMVNAAAYTAVDQAEAEQDVAYAVNAAGAGHIAAAAARKNIPVIQLSTDYVFDGESAEPYDEDTPVSPVSAYGRSKLEGEIAVRASNPNSVILRTAWVYSPFGKNFIKTMLRLASQREEIAVVDDQRGSPTSALDIADAVFAVCRNLTERPEEGALRGVFHMAGAGDTTWAGLAAYVFEQSSRMGGPHARVRPISTAEYPTPARRPANSRLNTSKLSAVYGISLPDWRTSVRPCVQRLIEELTVDDGR